MTHAVLAVGLIGVSAWAVAVFPRSVLVFLLFQGSLLFAYVARIPSWLRVTLLGLALLVLMPTIGFFNGYYLEVATQVGIFVALALGLNIVVGLAGLLDLGYVAFFAVGAYSWAIPGSPQANLIFGGNAFPLSAWWFYAFLFVGLMVAAGAGILLGLPVLRLHGDYLAIVTLGFGEIVPIVARNTPYLTNGSMGLNGVAPPNFFGYHFGVDSLPYYYVGLAMIVVLIFVSYRLKDSRVGRAWMAIREDEIAAGAMGVNRVKLKLLAFAIGAGFAGSTGTLYVAKLQTATPEMFMFPVSVMILVMIVLGGMGSVAGVVLGALILALLQSWFLQDLTQWIHAFGRLVDVEWLQEIELIQSIELIFGLILVFMMLFRRQGMIPATGTTAPLTLDQQTALPSRGEIQAALSGLGKGADLPVGTPLLETRKLTKRFGGITAVKELDLVVMPHQIVALIGPNGSGKSTFFNVVTGLDQPNGGRIIFMGEDIT